MERTRMLFQEQEDYHSIADDCKPQSDYSAVAVQNSSLSELFVIPDGPNATTLYVCRSF